MVGRHALVELAAGNTMTGACLARPIALLLSVALMAPLAVLLLTSLAGEWRYPALWPSDVALGQWRLLARDAGALTRATLTSAGIGAVVAALATAAGLITSERIARHPHRRELLTLAVLPVAVSPVVLALSMNDAFIRVHLAGTAAGVIAAQTAFAYAYATLLLNSLWNPRLRTLTELAVALGADRRQLWGRLWLPLAAPFIGVCLFQTFLMSWCDFTLARLFGAGRVVTLPVRVFEYFASGDLRLAAACGLLLVTPPLLALLYNREWLAWPLARATSAPNASARVARP